MSNSKHSPNGLVDPPLNYHTNSVGETVTSLPERIAVIVPLENREYDRLYDEQLCNNWLDTKTEQLVEMSALMALNTVRGYWLDSTVKGDPIRQEVLKDSAKRMVELFTLYQVYSPRYQWVDVRCISKDEIVLLGSVLQREVRSGDFVYQRG